MKRPRLTTAELDAIVGIAGDVDAMATIESSYEEHERDAAFRAWTSGMEKLRVMLAARYEVSK